MSGADHGLTPHSTIASKVTHKTLTLYLSIYLLILVLLILMLSPSFFNIAHKHAAATLSMVCDEISNTQETLDKYMDTLYYYPMLEEYLLPEGDYRDPVTTALISSELSTFAASHPLILEASIEDSGGNYINSHYYRNVVSQGLMEGNSHYRNLFEYSSGSYYYYIPPDIFRTEDDTYQYHVLSLSKKMYFQQKPFVVTAYYNLNTAFRHIRALAGDTLDDFVILDKYNEAVYDDGPSWMDSPEELAESLGLKQISGSRKTLTGVYYYIKNPTTGWVMISYASYTVLLSNLFTVILIITVLYAISPLLYAMLLKPTTAGLLAPLVKLHDAMKTYRAGDCVTLELKTGDEIQELARQFNEMAEKINGQIDDIRRQEHENSVVNYKLLATQVDPHFIYNTMNIINILARKGDTEAITEINSALICILRERLNSKLSITDTIANELETLRQYELIMDYRYENRVHTFHEVDSSLSDRKIPKNILQPLVENAFYHGFGSGRFLKEGHIDITIYSVEEDIVIEVSDDGAGMSRERLEMLMNRSYRIYDDQKPHIGLDNIRQRLDYIYRGMAQFDIQSTEGYGTTISITVPSDTALNEEAH